MHHHPLITSPSTRCNRAFTNAQTYSHEQPQPTFDPRRRQGGHTFWGYGLTRDQRMILQGRFSGL